MDQTNLSFEQIMNTTLRLLRNTWKAPSSVFLQTDEHGMLSVRASDGISKYVKALTIDGKKGPMAKCLEENRVVETLLEKEAHDLGSLVKKKGKNQKLVLVPVMGQARPLGVLVLGPFSKSTEMNSREAELRSAGALCAVLSAHWRLYEWMSQYLTQVNHEIRTPLTAVQGSLGMVLGGVFGQVGGEAREMLEMAQKGCERTVRAIEGYLNKQQFPTKPEK